MGALLVQAAVIRLVQTENGSTGTGRAVLRHKASPQYENREGGEHLNSMWDNSTGCCICCLWTNEERWSQLFYNCRSRRCRCVDIALRQNAQGLSCSALVHLRTYIQPRRCTTCPGSAPCWGVVRGGLAGNIFPHCVPSFPSGTICCLSSLCSNRPTASAE